MRQYMVSIRHSGPVREGGVFHTAPFECYLQTLVPVRANSPEEALQYATDEIESAGHRVERGTGTPSVSLTGK